MWLEFIISGFPKRRILYNYEKKISRQRNAFEFNTSQVAEKLIIFPTLFPKHEKFYIHSYAIDSTDIFRHT
jgi:hypothetical protein